MTDNEAGYLQALKDVQVTVRQMVNELGASPEGKLELLAVLSFLDGLIKTKVARHGGGDEPGRANENRRPGDE